MSSSSRTRAAGCCIKRSCVNVQRMGGGPLEFPPPSVHPVRYRAPAGRRWEGRAGHGSLCQRGQTPFRGQLAMVQRHSRRGTGGCGLSTAAASSRSSTRLWSGNRSVAGCGRLVGNAGNQRRSKWNRIASSQSWKRYLCECLIRQRYRKVMANSPNRRERASSRTSRGARL